MASPDVDHGVLVAVGIQTVLGTANAAIVALSDADVDETDGIILGDIDSGDDNTGITLPEFVRQSQAIPDHAGSFTKKATLFEKIGAEGMAITFQLKGSGAANTPLPEEAKPLVGIDALYEGAGLVGLAVVAGDPKYAYTPNAGTKYITIRLWSAEQSWVFQDCLVETLTFPFVGGETTVVTASIRVGSVLSHDILALPGLIEYGTMETLTPPLTELTAYQWGSTRGFGNLTVEISNAIEDIEDSNKIGGIRIDQSERAFNVTGSIWMDDADIDFEYQQVIDGAVAVTATGRVGTLDADPLNGFSFALVNLDVTSVNYEKAGAFTRALIEGNLTSTTPNTEFTLTFD